LQYIGTILLVYSFINKSKDKLNTYDPLVSWNYYPWADYSKKYVFFVDKNMVTKLGDPPRDSQSPEPSTRGSISRGFSWTTLLLWIRENPRTISASSEIEPLIVYDGLGWCITETRNLLNLRHYPPYSPDSDFSSIELRSLSHSHFQRRKIK
jgi:hypothetical protein